VPAFRLVSTPVSMFADRTAFLARRLRLPTLAAVLVVIVVVAGGIAWWQPWALIAEAQRLSIVVLPFDNLSGNPKQDYLADGITEDLITDLSRIRGAFVIARGTSFTYKGKTVNAKDVAQELNVRYVLEGSVQREGNQVRVSTQLVDGDTGANIWSERFDRKFKDVFSLQNDVTGRIAGVLKGELLAAESRQLQRGRPENLDAWELALQGFVEAFENPRTVDQYREAKALLDKAVAADPKLVIGWIGLAHLHYIASTRGYLGISRDEAKKMLLETAQRAVALDPKNADAQTELGLAYRINFQPDKAKASCETALELNPNYDEAYACVGLANIALGKPDAAIPLLENALKLNPRHNAFLRQFFIGMARILMGQPDKAVANLKKGLADFPTHAGLNLALISALALSGRDAEAQKALSNFLKMKSASNWNTIERVRANFVYVAPDIDKLLEGLRRAGTPETKADTAPSMSIVVLPFENLSGDKDQDYFADGITEDAITDLSRIRGAFVIARGTSFTYKGKAVNAKEVANKLNVRYVLEGSVQRNGDQVRINAELIDGETGADIWSERFDRQFRDVFSLQNDVTGRIASALRLELLEAESNRLKQGPPASMEAWDYALRGWAGLWTKPVSKESTQEAKRLLDMAIALDPKLAMAWTGMARVYFVSGIYPFGFGGRVESFKKALQAAETATALDPKSAAAQVELGMALRARRRYDEAANACQKAIDLNRNFEQGYSCLALVKQAIGDPKASLPLFEQSLRLAPHLPTDQRRYHFIAWGYLLAGQYEEALTYANKSSTVDPKFSGPYWVRAAVYGCQGKQKEAKAELAKLAQRDKFISTLEGVRRQYAHVKGMERIFGCLRRAGMPEK
jgi:TolB-like protein/Tfp pilus assembly protein PilF